MTKRVTDWCDFPMWYPDAENRIVAAEIKPLLSRSRWDVTRFKRYHEALPIISLLLGPPRCQLCGSRVREGERIIGASTHAAHFWIEFEVELYKPGDIAAGVG